MKPHRLHYEEADALNDKFFPPSSSRLYNYLGVSGVEVSERPSH
jgi:hypothetical protein